MTVYIPPPNRYADLAHPPPYHPPIDVGVETATWRDLQARWLSHAQAGGRDCPRCSCGEPCPVLSAYGRVLTGILHRATLWGPVR